MISQNLNSFSIKFIKFSFCILLLILLKILNLSLYNPICFKSIVEESPIIFLIIKFVHFLLINEKKFLSFILYLNPPPYLTLFLSNTKENSSDFYLNSLKRLSTNLSKYFLLNPISNLTDLLFFLLSIHPVSRTLNNSVQNSVYNLSLGLNKNLYTPNNLTNPKKEDSSNRVTLFLCISEISEYFKILISCLFIPHLTIHFNEFKFIHTFQSFNLNTKSLALNSSTPRSNKIYKATFNINFSLYS
jgi:hypothetical protein